MKHVIITGANSGLGLETAKKIAKASKEYHLILACRNIQKAEQAEKEIREFSGNEQVSVMQLDTASLSSVKAFAEAYRQAGQNL